MNFNNNNKIGLLLLVIKTNFLSKSTDLYLVLNN